MRMQSGKGLVDSRWSKFYGRAARVNWHCGCDCRNYVVVTGAHLREGTTVSCGCFRSEMQFGGKVGETSIFVWLIAHAARRRHDL